MAGEIGATAKLFLKLGFLAFGGPSAHIAMLEDEVVERRRWMDRGHFLDLVGATNLIPGPNSTQMMMHVGWERHGLIGLLTAAFCFILPAAGLTILCAIAYIQLGQVPRVAPMLDGIKPAVLAIILAAVWRLGKTAVKDWRFALHGLLVAGAVLLGMDEILVLFAGTALGVAWLGFASRGQPALSLGLPLVPVTLTGIVTTAGEATVVAGATLAGLGRFFLKVGAILYGSGYVLIAFLEGDLVRDLGWITHAQLLDAVAIGQLTPGPVLTTATFIGYVLLGGPGAAVATAAIFLPSLVLVPLLNPVIPKLRKNAWASRSLDVVNVTAVALMAAVTLKLAGAAAATWPTRVIAVLALVGLLRFRLHAAWLVLGGALLGFAFHWIAWT